MKSTSHPRAGFAWLELLLALAAVVLLFQLFPSLWPGTLWALDIHNWSRTVWFAVNLFVVLGLLAVRFGPDLYEQWQTARAHHASERQKQQKQQELREQRETLERLQRGRARRLY